MEREYVVTLYRHEDLNDFYDDMETPGGNLYIPNRAVAVFDRRLISRNTHYMLTDAEAEQIKNDPRVKGVSLSVRELNIEAIANFEQTSEFWNKSYDEYVELPHRNWGVIRPYLENNPSNWGYNSNPNYSGTVLTSEEGKNVDIVIADGHMDPNHPEFAVNEDGSGGTRVNRYNWFQLNSVLGFGANSTYNYNAPVDDSATNHGYLTASMAAGSRYGWARKANIYNIWPYSTAYNNTTLNMPPERIFDYIRYWHNNKQVNTATGLKNPTVVNNSWGFYYSALYSHFSSGQSSVVFRGNTYSGTFSKTDLLSFGLHVNSSNIITIGAEVSYVNEDIIDCINDGIIMVSAAGNSSFKIDTPGGVDYNNYVNNVLLTNGFIVNNVPYHRGSSPYVFNYSINVGAINFDTNDSKVGFSCAGPGVDIWAPGVAIIGATKTGGAVDARNISYRIIKSQGTSFAAPLVAGVIACLLETYPRMDFFELRDYLLNKSKLNKINDQGIGIQFTSSLQGGPNRFLYFNKERSTQGEVYPKNNFKLRQSSGQLYPRPRIYRTTK